MYNLLITAGEDYWEESPASTDLGRFLEYTSDGLREKYKTLTDETIEEIKTYPALFAYEDHLDKPAKIGWIKSIERRYGSLRIAFEFDERFEPIDPKNLDSAKRALDIVNQFEMNRTHWAIKEVDLIEALSRKDVLKMSVAPVPSFKFSRQTVLFAADILQLMGHGDFDRFVLGLGIDEIDAGRNRGSLRARSVALGEYAVRQMEQPTADGEPLSLAVVRHAASLDPDYPEGELYQIDKRSRDGFWRGLQKDGYRYHDGEVLPSGMPHHIPAPPHVPAPPPAVPWKMPAGAAVPKVPIMPGSKPRVFIVHGRDEATKNDVARFVEKIGLEAVILHEQPNGGRTIIQKFQEESAGAVFAIVLMTPDDVGGLDANHLQPRARQNVIFELGFFLGRLGPKKVCALFSGNLEKPSDFEAVVYIPYSSNSDWKSALARELNHAEVAFDHSKVFL